MGISYTETITRHYNNGVHIQFEVVNDNDVYIISIKSNFKQKGFGTETITNFLMEFNNKNIYLFATSEIGTDLEILSKWYESLGFKKCNNLSYIPYNINYCKYKGDNLK